jgi:alpha-N-arabinofuranosidase
VSVVDAVATHDAGGGTTIFAVNRSLTDEVTLEIDTRALGGVSVGEAISLFDDDIHAANTLAHQDRVTPTANASVEIGEATVTITLPPVSWTVLTLA